MPTIKVQHNDEIRQFAVSSHSTWAEFSSTLRAIFSISPCTEVFLSYTDEDGDEVTLSSDVELIELFNQYVPEGGPVNFTLKTAEEIEQNEEDGIVIPNNKNSVSNSRKSSVCELSERGWVLEGISGHEIVVNKSKLEDDESSYDGEFENIDEDRKSVDIESRSENGGLSQEHTEDTEERAPLLHGVSRAEVDAPSEEEKTDLPDTEIPPSSPPPSAPNSDPTLDDLTQQLQSLVNQFQEFFVQNPQIMETANRLMHDVVESVKGDMETFGEWLKDMKRQIEENILKGTDVNANSNRTRNTGEASQHAYTPTYTPSARSDGACREIPFLSGMPGNIFNSQCTNNEERSSDQAKDELPRQRCHPHHWNANPYQRHNSHPPPFHPSHRSPHNLPQFPSSPHGHPSPPPPPPPQKQQHFSSHFTSDPSDHPNLPSSFTAPPPPPPPPPIPKHTTQEQQQEILPGTVPYVHEIFKNLGTRLGISNSANEDATDNMDYSPSHGPPRYFAYQTPDGDIRCGRGPFGGPKFGRSEYPGTSFGNVMDDNSSVNKADKTERTNSEHFERSDIDDKNVQDFVLAPDDLLADIRLLREMGFTQPTRELENLFRRNDNNIDEVLSILLEETENR